MLAQLWCDQSFRIRPDPAPHPPSRNDRGHSALECRGVSGLSQRLWRGTQSVFCRFSNGLKIAAADRSRGRDRAQRRPARGHWLPRQPAALCVISKKRPSCCVTLVGLLHVRRPAHKTRASRRACPAKMPPCKATSLTSDPRGVKTATL
jgi:hypothetical protein